MKRHNILVISLFVASIMGNSYSQAKISETEHYDYDAPDATECRTIIKAHGQQFALGIVHGATNAYLFPHTVGNPEQTRINSKLDIVLEGATTCAFLRERVITNASPSMCLAHSIGQYLTDAYIQGTPFVFPNFALFAAVLNLVVQKK